SAVSTSPSGPTMLSSCDTTSRLNAMAGSSLLRHQPNKTLPQQFVIRGGKTRRCRHAPSRGELSADTTLSSGGFAAAIQLFGGGRKERAVRRATTAGRGASAPLRSDSPGVARDQKLGDVAGAAIGQRPSLLLDHHVLVDGGVDVGQHADRHREVRGEEIGEQLGGVDALFIVHPEGA